MTAKTTAKPAPKSDALEGRVKALEHGLKVVATTLYAPNGGGADHVEEAKALFEKLVG